MKKFLLDVMLFALFVAELSFHHLPKILHEIFGVTFAAAILLHLYSSRRRFIALTKNFTPRKIFSLTVNSALTICTAVTVATGVCMSNFLFTVSFELRRNMTLHQLHIAAPYVMMILLGMHIGLHWRELRGRLLNFFGAEEFYRRRQNFFLLFDMMTAALGVAGLIMNRVGDRILMKHIFATPATELNGILFALMIAGGVMVFALVTSLLDEIFSPR